jgi:hypothetical protein
MVWFTKTPPRGIEIPRLIMAAHEVGHLIAFQESGVKVLSCEISGSEWGLTVVDEPADGQHHGYLVGIMAGAAGEKLWCEMFSQRLPNHCRTYRGDRDEFKRHQRKNRAARGLSERKAERLARVILSADPKKFRKLTEKLARDGELIV